MKSLSAYLKKLPAAERAAITAGAERKIAALRLQQAREAAGLTQEEVAERMGITQATLSRLEHRGDVKLSNIRRYIEAIGGRLEVNVVLSIGRATARKVGRASPRAAQKRIALVSA
jgi:transcriptional regulator with XRE-family HTH domain